MGCRTTNPLLNANWPMPDTPEKYPVQFVQKDKGLYLNEQSSVNLLKNIEELDAYVAKLEALVKEMKDYYGAK